MERNIVRDERLYDLCNMEVYRINNFDNVKELNRAIINTTGLYDTCEVIVCEEHGQKYIFGASRNGDWCGYKMRDNIKANDLFDLYAIYEEMSL